MPRDTRSKPSNVVKSRSAPSLLGSFASPRRSTDLPSNRFIELGDIALGNSRRHESNRAGLHEEETPKVQLPAPKHFKRKKAADTDTEPATLPQPTVYVPRVWPAPLTRPRPPKPATARPSLPLPPKNTLPKPPKIHRPKPVMGRLDDPKRPRPR